MTQFLSIRSFPDTWGANARCPVCKNRTMNVIHINSAADQLHCQNCGVSFEVEEKGEHIFFVQTPIDLEMQLKHHWVTRQQLASVLQNRSNTINTFQAPFINENNQPKGNPARAEAVRKARKLVELGNSQESIRRALKESMHLTDQAIDEIITDAVNVHKMKQKQQTKKYLIMGAMTLVVLIATFIFLGQIL